MTQDLSNWTRDQLESRVQMIKIELNAGYGKNPATEIARMKRLQRELDAIRVEMAKRLPA